MVVFRDVLGGRRLEEQLRQAQKMEALGTLAGGIAHDFNNILAAILGYTELVQGAMPMTSPVWLLLQRVLTAGLRAKGLVQQILAFSRRTPAERTPVSLAVVLRETLPFLRALLPATIAMEEHLTPEASLVLADATQLHQIVMNLGANAEYAMRDTGGLLAVRLEAVEVDAALAATHPALRPGPYVRLTVRDSGAGIPPDVIARMYEPFFTTKEVGHGTGLGLSVVHGIVENHGGTILVESTLGQGTTFTIYLPRWVLGPLLILLANCSAEDRVFDELCKSRRPRLGERFPHEPITHPHEVDRRRGQHMLEVGFRLPDVSRTAQPISAGPLGQRPLNARALGILRGILRRGFARARRLQRAIVLLTPYRNGAPFRPCAVHPVGTRLAIFHGKFDLHHLIGVVIHRWRPA